MNPYKTKNFTIQELVHPKILKDIGETNCWMRLNPLALEDLDTIRDAWFLKKGSGIYINRLNLGLDSRGLRPPDDPDGSFYTGHKMGHTFDLDPVNGDHEGLWNFVKELILNGELKLFNSMEDRSFTPTWTHVGFMNHGLKIWILKP